MERDTASPPSASSGQRAKFSRSFQGCITCRAICKKCDEQKPTCSRCQRLGRSCIYNSRMKVFAPSKRDDVSPQPYESSLSHIRVDTPIGTTAVHAFFNCHLCPGYVKGFASMYGPPVAFFALRDDSTQAGQLAGEAYALSSLSRVKWDYALSNKANVAYVKCLAAFRLELGASSARKDEELLAICFLMGCFELINNQRCDTRWSQHAFGAASLLNQVATHSSQPWQGPAARLLKTVKNTVVLSLLILGGRIPDLARDRFWAPLREGDPLDPLLADAVNWNAVVTKVLQQADPSCARQIQLLPPLVAQGEDLVSRFTHWETNASSQRPSELRLVPARSAHFQKHCSCLTLAERAGLLLFHMSKFFVVVGLWKAVKGLEGLGADIASHSATRYEAIFDDVVDYVTLSVWSLVGGEPSQEQQAISPSKTGSTFCPHTPLMIWFMPCLLLRLELLSTSQALRIYRLLRVIKSQIGIPSDALVFGYVSAGFLTGKAVPHQSLYQAYKNGEPL